MTEDAIKQPTTELNNSHNPTSPSETSAEREKRQKRLPKGTVPPALNLEEAIDIARRIHEMPSGEAPYDAAPDVFGNSATSSVFGKKMMALRDFGIATADDKKKMVSLTDLGRMIVAPKDEDDHLLSLGNAFLRISLFCRIYNRIKGRPLPQDQYLVNTISDVVPRELAKGWLENLKRSIKTAHLLDDSRPDGKVYVLNRPQLVQAANPSEEGAQMKDEKAGKPEDSSREPEPIRTPIPLGPGRLAHIELPYNWDKKELKKLLKMLELALGDDEGLSV